MNISVARNELFGRRSHFKAPVLKWRDSRSRSRGALVSRSWSANKQGSTHPEWLHKRFGTNAIYGSTACEDMGQ